MASAPCPFHLSLPVRNLAAQRDFYVNVLGARACRAGAGSEDFEFFGHQLTFHERPTSLSLGYETLHWGAVVDGEEFERLERALLEAGATFAVAPHTQKADSPDTRRKMVFLDPNGYAIELKSYSDPTRVLVSGAAYTSR